MWESRHDKPLNDNGKRLAKKIIDTCKDIQKLSTNQENLKQISKEKHRVERRLLRNK